MARLRQATVSYHCEEVAKQTSQGKQKAENIHSASNKGKQKVSPLTVRNKGKRGDCALLACFLKRDRVSFAFSGLTYFGFASGEEKMGRMVKRRSMGHPKPCSDHAPGRGRLKGASRRREGSLNLTRSRSKEPPEVVQREEEVRFPSERQHKTKGLPHATELLHGGHEDARDLAPDPRSSSSPLARAQGVTRREATRC